MKNLVLFVSTFIFATVAFASEPQVPVGVKLVAFMNVDLILENKDWLSTWDRFTKASHRGASMIEEFTRVANNKYFRELVSSNKFDIKSVRWVMSVDGKVDYSVDQLQSNALIIGGSIDAKRLCKSFSDIVNADKPGSVKEIESEKYNAYVIDVAASFDDPEITRYVGSELYYAPLDDYTMVIACKEKMLRAFQDVYFGKRNGSKRFVSIFKREPNRVIAIRRIDGQYTVKQMMLSIDKGNIARHFHPFFDIAKNVDGWDIIFSTAEKEQKFEFILSMKDVASAVECEEYLRALATYAHLCVLAGDNTSQNPVCALLDTLLVEREGAKVSVSIHGDLFKSAVLIQQFDGDDAADDADAAEDEIDL